MQAEQLKGVAVVSVPQADKLGAIEDVLLDLQQHHIGAVLLHGGMFHGGPLVPWSEVRSVGQDAVMVDESKDATREAGDTSQVYGTRLSSLRGTKIVTDTGDLIGTLSGADVDTATGQITSYVVTASEGGSFFHARPLFTLPPEAIVGVGRDLITVDAKVVDAQRDNLG
jgi:sporulation protein YlmC with PRC-barrel domain